MKVEQTLNVLIADDSPLIVNRLTEFLGGFPFINITATTGTLTDTLTKAKEHCLDIIFLDIQLSDGNGLGILETLKEIPHAPIVIVFTFFSYPQYKTRAMSAGADYFINKTNNFLEVEEALKQITEQKNSSVKKDEEYQYKTR